MTDSIPDDKRLRLEWFNKLIDKKNRCINLRRYVYNSFGKKLEKNQYFALRDMLDPKVRKIYFSTARQAGKTETIAIFQALATQFPDCVIPNYEGKAHCYVFAPKQEQAQISFERYSNLIHYNDLKLFPESEILLDKADRMKFNNGFEVRAITASRNSEIEGLTTHVIILDESQAISPYKVRECLTGDTPIPLADGSFTTLKKVVDNKLNVLTPNGEEKPTKFFEHDEDDIYEIKLSNGKILKCNENHRHLVFNRDWRMSKNPHRKLNTLELKINDRLAFIDKLPYFGKEGKYDEGFILGSMLGDGSFSFSAPSFVGTPKAIKILGDKITSVYNNVTVTKQRATKSKYVKSVNFIGNKPGVKDSNNFTNYLKGLELYGKIGQDKFIPNKAWSKQFLRGLVSSLIETDGSICIPRKGSKKDGRIGGSIEFTNKALGIIKPLQDYLLKFGIHCSIKHDHNRKGKGTCYTLSIKSVEDVRRFHKEFKLTSKQNKLNKLILLLKEKKGRNSSKYYSKDLRFIQIKSIKKLSKKEKVYCVQVSGDHLWITDGIVTNNSILPMGGGVQMGAKIIQCGVPGTLGSHFHKAFKDKYDEVTNRTGYVHHIYPWKECPRLAKDYILGQRKDDIEAFERNYELNWSRNNLGYFIDEDQYEACEEDYDPKEKRKEAVEKQWEIHWGLDFAKLRDSTVLTEMALDPETGIFWIVGLVELQGTDYIDQIGLFINMFNPTEVVHCSADQTTVGEPIVELMNDKGIRTTGLIFTAPSKDKLYKNYKFHIENKKVKWPLIDSIKSTRVQKAMRKFKQQMMELEVEHKVSGYVSYHHNLDDNMARDDHPDSSALSIWSATQYVPPSIGYIEDL